GIRDDLVTGVQTCALPISVFLIFKRMSERLPSRNELLSALISIPGTTTDGTLLDDAQKKFHEILNSSKSPTLVEWLFTQLIGPRSEERRVGTEGGATWSDE